jgi:hypothetical protein
MCLLIHKPVHAAVPEQLLESAATFNPHGYGFLSYDQSGELVVRRSSSTSTDELHGLYDEFRDAECVIHLRYGTSGAVDVENTHPLQITDNIYLAHNGTLNLARHIEERSDSWHFVNDYLKPLLSNRPELLYDRFFQELVSNWCGPHNRFVFVDGASQQTVIVNRELGFELDGLWLSNTRWFDASRFNWHPARSHAALQGPQAIFAI